MRALHLHDIHAARGARFGERGGAEIVLGYGAAGASHPGPVIVVDRSHLGRIACKGPETRLFLHGMLTNEVKALHAGQGTYAAVITAKGKMLGDVRLLLVGENDALLDLEPEALAGTLAHLEQFLISEDCELSATAEHATLGVYGARAADALARVLSELPPPLLLHHHAARTALGWPALVVAAAPAGVPGFDLLLPPAAAAATFDALASAAAELGGGIAGDDALEASRITAGIPRFGADMDESTIPLEANLERAISYTKGCYVGQEVIAKATYRGHVRRKLTRLRVPPGTVVGARLIEGETSLGQITSVLDPGPEGSALALGYVRAARLTAGARLPIEGGGEAEVLGAPPPAEGP